MFVITTVTSPAESYDLTDLATVKDEIGLTDTATDTFLSRAIRQASRVAANYCNRPFVAEGLRDEFRIAIDYVSPPCSYAYAGLYDAYGTESAALQLSRFPIINVASVVQVTGPDDTQSLTQDSDFKVDADTGWLLRQDCASAILMPWEWISVTVEYTAGFSEIPDDVVEAVLRLVTMKFKQRNRDPMLMSENNPTTGDRRWWVGSMPNQNGAIPPEIAGLLDPYRIPSVA